MDPHYKPKTVRRPSQVYNRNPYTNKTASSLRIGVQVTISLLYGWAMRHLQWVRHVLTGPHCISCQHVDCQSCLIINSSNHLVPVGIVLGYSQTFRRIWLIVGPRHPIFWQASSSHHALCLTGWKSARRVTKSHLRIYLIYTTITKELIQCRCLLKSIYFMCVTVWTRTGIRTI